MLKRIVKRDGSIEDFNPIKVNKWAEWASEEIKDRIDWGTIVMHAVRSLGEEASSQQLQTRLIKECIQMKSWPYSLMAGRLYASLTSKQMYPDGVPTVKDFQAQMVQKGLMRAMDYSDKDYAAIEEIVNHKHDHSYAYFQIKQNVKKYGLSDEVKDINYESSQFMFARMAMALAEDEHTDERLFHLKNWYTHFSNGQINSPSPNYRNLGTNHNGYASCCLYATDDTAPSIAAGNHIAEVMTYMSAGIGGVINCRSKGDPVRGGAITHKGKWSYFNNAAAAVNGHTQGGRGGSATEYSLAFDPEQDMISRLQNPLTTPDLQIRGIHFAMMHNRLIAKKVARNEDIFQFNTFTAPDLYEAALGGDKDLFEALYNKYEKDESFVKTYVNARRLIIGAYIQRNEVATYYTLQIDEANRHTPHKQPVRSSNLCVAPETLLLTDRGHVPIAHLENQTINVWNGEEFSETTVVKTGEDQELWTVSLSDGRLLECTPYHKWYVVDDYRSPLREVRTHELNVGDRLVKLSTPVIQGYVDMDAAYENGFYCGDGTELSSGYGRIYLYGEKKSLTNMFPMAQGRWRGNGDRLETEIKGLHPKFFVPTSDHTAESRLKWFAGWMDADGTVYRNGTNEALVGSSSNLPFLKNVQNMLQTLGVNAKIVLGRLAGSYLLPKNDGSGDFGYYGCQNHYRLLISSGDSQLLLQCGLDLKRLQITQRDIQREAQQFATVVSVVNAGRRDSTYCVSEPKRHMAVFNGILTGQCVEITQPTRAFASTADLYSKTAVGYIVYKSEGLEKPVRLDYSDMVQIERAGKRLTTWAGDLKVDDKIITVNFSPCGHIVNEIVELKAEPEVSTCSLAGLVVSNIDSDEEYESAAYYAAKMIDKCIDISHYELPHIGYTAKNRRNAGIGILGLATHMARKGLKYDTPEGLAEIDRVMERHAYFCIKAALRLGREKGNAAWMHKTKWPEGWLPIDTYKPQVDELIKRPYAYDWETLRTEIIANGGIRFSSVIALMPTESSSKSSGAPNGPYPIRDLDLKKTDHSLSLDWVAPDNDILAEVYQLAWEIATIDQIKFYAVMQKWCDQSISADFYRDRVKYPTISEDELIEEYLLIVKYGVKSQYYANSYTGDSVDINEIESLHSHPQEAATEEVQQPELVKVIENTTVAEKDELAEFGVAKRADQRGCASGACAL